MQGVVSVIIPVHNGIRHIGAALDCIFLQTYAALEVIVVDDGSTDGTVAMLEERYGDRIRLIRQPKTGHAAARNTGVRAATGEYLSFLDHDDLWPEHKTELQLRTLEEYPEAGLVFGHVQNFLDDEIPQEQREGIVATMEPKEGTLPGAMMARRVAFDQVGMFVETVDMGDFLDWYGRAKLLNIGMIVLPDVLMRRRIHNTNFSRHNRQLQGQYLHTLKRLLDERRLAAAKKAG